MFHFIVTPVGVNGANRFDDVENVQLLLNQVPAQEGGPEPKLDVDGICGPKTIAAIRNFQQAKFNWNDGLVEPYRKTLGELLKYDVDAGDSNLVRFAEAAPLSGFDWNRHSRSPSQIVPQGGAVNVRLLQFGGPEERVDRITVNDSTVASAEMFGSLVKITGLKHGRTLVKARNRAGRVLSILDVGVKRRKYKSISFYFVKDKKRRTARTKTNLDKNFPTIDSLIAALNRIYVPQTNTQFVQHQMAVDPLEFPQHDFGEEVDYPEEWNTVVKKRPSGADFNVYFVWDYNAFPGKGDTADAGTISWQRSCLCDDEFKRNRKLDKVLAHEAGHNFVLGDGEEDHVDDPENVMHVSNDESRKLNRRQADKLNP